MKLISTAISILVLSLVLSGCWNSDNKVVQGYVEGKYTYLSSPIDGKLIQLNVMRGDQVKVGDPIFILDQQPETDKLKQAQNNLAQAEQTLIDLQKGQRATVMEELAAQRAQIVSQLKLDKITLDRYENLLKKGYIDKQSVDTARTTYKTDLKRLTQADANIADAKLGARENQIKAQEQAVKAASDVLKQTQWALDQKTKAAPVTGQVFDTYYRLGEFVPAGQPVASILAPENVYLVFYVSETILSKVANGQTVSFTCDSCKQKYQAKIYFISSNAEYTPPVIYSKDSRDKLVYRIEAALTPDIAVKLHAGQPVDVRLQK
jgi:HlyD family secretion protein